MCGQTEEARRTTDPQWLEQKTNYRNSILIKTQKVMSQKEQNKTPEKQLNGMEIVKLPEKLFRIMLVKMIQYFRKSMEKMQEMFTKNLELKNKQR